MPPPSCPLAWAQDFQPPLRKLYCRMPMVPAALLGAQVAHRRQCVWCHRGHQRRSDHRWATREGWAPHSLLAIAGCGRLAAGVARRHGFQTTIDRPRMPCCTQVERGMSACQRHGAGCALATRTAGRGDPPNGYKKPVWPSLTTPGPQKVNITGEGPPCLQVCWRRAAWRVRRTLAGPQGAGPRGLQTDCAGVGGSQWRAGWPQQDATVDIGYDGLTWVGATKRM